MEEKEYTANVYRIEYEPRKQIYYDDIYENPLANDLEFCLSKRITIELQDKVYILDYIYSDGEVFLGLYGIAPPKDDPHTANRSYKDFEITPKDNASTKQTIFCVDINKKLLTAIDIEGIKNFNLIFRQVLKKRNVDISPIKAHNWKKHIIDTFKSIDFVEVKKKDDNYLPSFMHLPEEKAIYLSSKFKLNVKVDEVPIMLESEDAFVSYKTLIMRGKNNANKSKTFDIFKDIILKRFPIKLIPEYFNNLEENKNYFKTKLMDLLASVPLTSGVLLEEEKDVV